MLRITQAKLRGKTAILLEGRLAEQWVEELQAAYRSSNSPSVLDLSGVTFVDARGVAALGRLRAQGAEIVGASIFVEELLRASD